MSEEEKRKSQRAADKRYYWKHREEKKASSRKYQREHSEERKNYDIEYFKKHRQEKKEYYKKYRQDHPEYMKRRREYVKKRYKKNLESWRSFFSNLTSCEVCGKQIMFNSGMQNTTIHFDHRHEGRVVIKDSPSVWLIKTNRTPENETIWKSCDFGALCINCNSSLPTKNRLEWVEKVLRYVKKRSDYDKANGLI